MTKNIFFDFDGTLINCSSRLYLLFSELVSESTFTFEEYWEIKRNRINQKDLLVKYFEYKEDNISNFKKLWMEKVEDRSRLKTDVPFEKSTKVLKILSKNYNLYIVTNRQSKEKVVEQIKDLGWSKLLTDILVTEQKISKEELIRKSCLYSKEDYFIGDTGEDIKTGQSLGIKTIAVASGFLNKEVLKEYNPDKIIEGINKIDENYFL